MGLVIMLLDMTGLSEKYINRSERRQSKMYVYVRNVTSFCLQWTWDKIQDSAEELVPELKNKKGNSNTGSSNQKSV